ncbi:hypothetical protein RvY_06798 [Ramazzottius varieornatus]|uniref:G-protein coupled receptors family 1 profile domain-containing protein n=1 Tax=Ramazzottius varieornatus TaxID=947166 RepID=A0A1D1V8G9_RAMVA|nr:hypothetical protein RvY_06798 [Ramazzottius varieornatus]
MDLANLSDYFNQNITRRNFTVFDDRAHWTACPVVLAIIIPIAAVLNGGVCIVLILTRQSQPPFNIYLINLTFSNFCFILCYLPLDIVNSIYVRWTLGRTACAYYQFAYWLFHGCLTNSHVLLTMNRLWAIFFPLHYHRHQIRHRNRATLICVGMWIYVSGFLTIGIVMTPVLVDTVPCTLETDKNLQWAKAAQTVLYDIPLVFLAFAVPLVWYKRRLRRTRPVQVLNARERDKHQSQQQAIAVAMTANSTFDSSKSRDASVLAVRKAMERSYFQLWLVLTSMTVLCWAPLICYYAVVFYGGPYYVHLVEVGTFLYAVTPVIDPILLMIIIPVLRVPRVHT